MDNGSARPGKAPPTLHDVAREAGVSIATASRALNGSSRNVRSENARRVRAAAAKLNYQPHLSAQAIAKGSTRTVALVIRDVADPYFASIAAGVTRAAEAARLIVTMAVADGSPERELEIVRTLRGQRPRVIIVAGGRVAGAATREALIEELEEYRTAGGRVVMISQRDLPFGTVTIDNHGGARDLARALLDAGYRRFAVFHAPEEIRTSRERHDGFRAGLREWSPTAPAPLPAPDPGEPKRGASALGTPAPGASALGASGPGTPAHGTPARGAFGLGSPVRGASALEMPVSGTSELEVSGLRVSGASGPAPGASEFGAGVAETVAIETAFTRAGGYDAARRLVERGFDDVEAVFAVNDVMAVGAMAAFRDAGVVPGVDIAVAGFDDIGSALDVVPALTSVSVPLEEAGLTAMRLALSDDEDAPDAPDVPDVPLPARVVLRESTPPRHGKERAGRPRHEA